MSLLQVVMVLRSTAELLEAVGDRLEALGEPPNEVAQVREAAERLRSLVKF